jgi:hypothetical protein
MPALLATACLVACDDDPASISIEVTAGHETDAFSRDPPIATVQIDAVGLDGATLVSTSAAPGEAFSLGEVARDALVRFEVTGRDAGGAVRLRGRSLAVVPDALRDGFLPVFAQRIGEWARPPGALAEGREAGVAGAVAERWLMLAGGGAATARGVGFYDLLALGGSRGNELPRAPRSLVVAASADAVLLVDDAGASAVELRTGAVTDLAPPTGLDAFGMLAGGATVTGEGTSYLVGATRPKDPTDAVLVVADDFTFSAARLAAPRAGAAATWVEGLGLVVAGGSPDAPGVETLAPGASAAKSLSFATDATVGAAAVARPSGEAVLVGGLDASGRAAAVRLVDPRCSSRCTAKALGVALPSALVGAHAFSISADRIVVVGSEPAGGQSRAFELDLAKGEARALPLREPRRGAVAVPAPNGTLALFGGTLDGGGPALTVETLFPP